MIAVYDYLSGKVTGLVKHKFQHCKKKLRGESVNVVTSFLIRFGILFEKLLFLYAN
jgi:hypothetical protein